MSPPQQSRDVPSTANGPPMEFITMSQRELSRLQAAQRVLDRSMSVAEAAECGNGFETTGS